MEKQEGHEAEKEPDGERCDRKLEIAKLVIQEGRKMVYHFALLILCFTALITSIANFSPDLVREIRQFFVQDIER